MWQVAIPAALGLAAGIIKNEEDEAKKKKEEERRRAEIMALPWLQSSFTRPTPIDSSHLTVPRDTSLMSNILGGILGGAQFGIDNQNLWSQIPSSTSKAKP
jgi:hypothetical protein